MEILYLILLILIIVLLLTIKNNLIDRIERLEDTIHDLKRVIEKGFERRQATEIERPMAKAADAAPAPPKPAPQKQPEIAKPIPSEHIGVKPVPPVQVEQQKEVITDNISAIRRPVKTTDTIPPKVSRQAEPEPSFFEHYPDLEKFIGENLVNKIGIAILVLAIGFFVKYAIDNNWIGPVGRVGIGVLCGGILIGIAHRMRNTYKAFSSVLVGGGLAILYFTITLAYHQFHLFDQTASFVILIIITCFAVALSLLYNRQELAVIALVGGLSSPFMVSGDTANYHALFIYLVTLNAGLLVIAYQKLWRVLNASAFGLTVLVFAGIVFSLTPATYSIGLLYASILYLMFFAINVANNVRENTKFIASDFSILLINTALYFGVGLYLLTIMEQEQFRGLFCALLAVINLGLSFILLKNKKVDANVLYLLIGITLTFISLAAPIQLHGHNITLFWAAESVLLYWLYQKSNIQLMKLTALVIWLLMLTSLGLDWINVYSDAKNTLTIIANKGFITTLIAAVGSYLLFVQVNRDEHHQVYGMAVKADLYQYVAFVLLFLSGLFEVNHQFLSRYPDTGLNALYLMLYVPVFVYVFYMVSKRLARVQLGWRISASVLTLCVAVYLLFNPQFYELQFTMLALGKVSATHFAAHWLGAVFVGLIFYQLILMAKTDLADDLQSFVSWLLAAAIVLFLSLEAGLASTLIFYSPANSIDAIEQVFIKVGLPILWGLSSFAMMWLGMRNKQRTLRIISLTLFTITLVKLFVFDIQNIPPAGKIAAFFCLGVLLLIVSFMYQKVKKIIVEDEAQQNE